MPTSPPDAFSRQADTSAAPSRDAFMVTPHDVDPLPRLPQALLIGTAGQIALRAADSAADIVFPVSAGQILPIRVAYVRATGTTATDIVGLA